MAVKVFNGLPYKLKVISNDAREFQSQVKRCSLLKFFLYFGGIFQ
jgi:hypothetical protein